MYTEDVLEEEKGAEGAESKRKEDPFFKIIHPGELLPFYAVPVVNGLKTVLMFAAMGGGVAHATGRRPIAILDAAQQCPPQPCLVR